MPQNSRLQQVRLTELRRPQDTPRQSTVAHQATGSSTWEYSSMTEQLLRAIITTHPELMPTLGNLPLATKILSRHRNLTPKSMSDVNAIFQHMEAALQMARKALESDEVPVGCVFVRNGAIIGRGMNDTNRSLCGHRHAEFLGIEQILASYEAVVFHETDLFVTVEPCVMCASALRQLGIRAVYFGATNDRFGGCGSVFDVNCDRSPEPAYRAYPGFYREEAITLLRKFYTRENSRAPTPQTKKMRTLKYEIEPLDYSQYISRDEFIHFFGDDKLQLFDQTAQPAKRRHVSNN